MRRKIMFGTRLKELRTAYDLNQVQLAKELGVSKQSVSNWENDNILPSIDMLIRIAKRFSVSCDYLLELDDRNYLEVTGISSSQRAIIQKIIDEFKKA